MPELIHHRTKLSALPDGIESTFGRAFGAFFGDQAHGVRLGFQRDCDHLLGRRHLEIKRFVDLGFKPSNIIVANMTPIFAQMCRDAVAAGGDCKFCRAYRIRVTAPTCVANGGDVIDIDAEAKTIHALAVHPFGLGNHRLRAQLRKDRGEMLEVIDLEVNRNIRKIRRPSRHADIVDVAIVFGYDLCDLR